MASKEALVKAKKQHSLGYQIKRNKACYVMLAPYFILFFLFTVLPVLTSIALSFTYFNMLEWPTFNGWNNYIKLFLEDLPGIPEKHPDLCGGDRTCQLPAVSDLCLDHQ